MSFSHPLLVIAHFEFPDLLDLNDYLVRPLTALVALSTHVKDLGCISLTSTHGMCHESLITLG